MAALHEFALGFDATELFEGGQARHVPFGEVLTVPQVAESAQHLHRGFFRPVGGAPPAVRLPGPLARFEGTPCPPAQPPPQALAPVEEVRARWADLGGSTAEAAGAAQRPAEGPPAGRPLEGIRVVDFTHVLAGPFATRVLADLGADIVKVQTESRSQGAHANDFPYFPMWNRSKRSLCLDMTREGAAEALRALVEQADVVIENFSAGVLDRWGVGWEQLSAWNPGLVYVAMQGAGNDGPWREYVTFAPTVHALCGLTALTGPEGRLDCGTGVALNDHASGLAGAFAVLAALEARRRTGRGQFIDLSQLEVGTYLVGPALLDWLANGREAVAAGTRDAFSDPVPNDVVRSGDDRWLAVTAADDVDWARVAALVGVDDAGLATVAGRRERRDEVRGSVAAWAAGRAAEEAAVALQEVGVAAYAVQDAPHLTGQDPQLAHRRWVVDVDSPILGTQHTDRFPAELSDAAGPIELRYAHSPYLGEHSFEVAGELLGLDEAAVAERIGDGLFT
jgi:crotonobetainyl-CoA:carnitine CoA-transferase CaiB-like acyl-CoA transferase